MVVRRVELLDGCLDPLLSARLDLGHNGVGNVLVSMHNEVGLV